ncbi:MAG: ABC transporter permease [Thiotrichales bacterium]|nr:ABC transporter permease [Thiotrichales bacterium]
MIANLIVRRILLGIVTIWVMSILVFFGIEILPGDIADAILGQGATEETLHAIRTELGLYRPAYVRYFDWLGGLLRGDVGEALGTGRSIVEMMAIRLPTTLTLGGLTAAIAVPLSLSLGLLAAMYPGSFFDRTITFGTLIVISGPEFLIATLLVMLFAIELRWVPAVSYLSQDPTFQQLARAMLLPVMTLVFAVLAPMTRMTRSAVLNVMTSPAIEMAILKGVPRMRIVLWHALPNAFAPIVNVVAINLAYLITGVVVVEVIFSFPGVAKLMVDGVQSRDIPVVQACAMLFCAIYVGFYILADVISIASNPRLRHPK